MASINAGKKHQKRTIRVFYSSPFRGLEREREMLSGVYWPRISQACAQRGFTFVPIDFRWGITEESSSAANTVSICLHEVARCDLFVGFFGARYGWHGASDSALQQAVDKALPQHPWLDNYRDRSVTEMEFLEARLRHPVGSSTSAIAQESVGHGELLSTSESPGSPKPSAFLFRDPAYDAEMSKTLEEAGDLRESKVYTAAIDGPNAELFLQNLKKSVASYNEELNTLANNKEGDGNLTQLDYCTVQYYKTPQEGARLMFDETMNMLNQYFLNTEQIQTQTKFDSWVDGQAAFMDTHQAIGFDFLGRVEDQKTIEEMISNPDSWRVVLKGEEGSGKTALLVNHIIKNQDKNSDIFVYYSMSAYPSASSAVSCLQYLVTVLERQAKPQNEVNSDEILNISDIGDLLERIIVCCLYFKQFDRKIIFILDEIDKIDSQQTTDIPLGFLPKRLPLKQVVCTKSTDSFHLPGIEEEQGDQKVFSLELQRFHIADAMLAVESALKVRGKSLNEFCFKTLEQCDQICNFLFLKILLEQLFSHAQFFSLEGEIKDLCNCQSITEIFLLFLDKLEIVMKYEGESYREGSAGEALCLLSLSHLGLMETEVMEMLGWESRLWATFFSTVGTTLLDNGNQVYSIQYAQLREAVELRYLTSDEEKLKFKNQLADYFWTKFQDSKKGNKFFHSQFLVPERIIQELPAALQDCKRHEQLRECLLDLSFFWTSSNGNVSQTKEKKGQKENNSLGFTGISMQTYKYAGYLKSSTDDVSQFIEILRRNVEEDIVNESANRYGSSSNCNAPRIRSIIEPLTKIFDFINDGIGMPNEGSKLIELCVVIERGVLMRMRNAASKEDAILEEIFLSEIFNRMGIILSYLNDYEASVGYLQRSLAIKRAHSDRRDLIPDIQSRIAVSLHTLGNTYKTFRKIEPAIPCFQEAVKIHSQNFSDKQWTSLDGLASCAFFVGDTQTAERMYRGVVEHYEQTALTTTDSQIAGMICNLANAVRRNGKSDEARALYKKAWDIQTQLLGDTHHSIAVTLMCLGNLEMACENFEAASSHYQSAYNVFRKTIGLMSHETALVVENIAMAMCNMGEFEEGTPWFHFGGKLLDQMGLLHMSVPFMNRLYLKYHKEKGNEEDVQTILQRMAKAGIPVE